MNNYLCLFKSFPIANSWTSLLLTGPGVAKPYLKLTFYHCADNWSIQTGLIGSTGAKFLFTLMSFCVCVKGFSKWSKAFKIVWYFNEKPVAW